MIDIDLVIVLLPASPHAVSVRANLAAGKDVLL
jgi:hypothetical protein